MRVMKRILIILLSIVAFSCGSSRESAKREAEQQQYEFTSNPAGKGPEIMIDFRRGESFYYPLIAIWLEDMQGNYLQTLYVAQSVATGTFRYGATERNRWTATPLRAPQTLPYWAHKRGVKASDGLYMPEPENPVADAYTGPTPVTGFVLRTRADSELPGSFRVLMEINQNWDWNRYWTNDKYPGDDNYLRSAQPAIVLEAGFGGAGGEETATMEVIGHSHYSGLTGELFRDLSTLTTALAIVSEVIVTVNR